MNKLQESYPAEVNQIKTGVSEIRTGAQDVKGGTSDLVRGLKEDGKDSAREALDTLRDRLKDVKAKGKSELHMLEEQVVARPGRSLAYAFFAGVVASVFFGGRR